jgi:hypothetical protein
MDGAAHAFGCQRIGSSNSRTVAKDEAERDHL